MLEPLFPRQHGILGVPLGDLLQNVVEWRPHPLRGTAGPDSVAAKTTTGRPSNIASMSDRPSEVQRFGWT